MCTTWCSGVALGSILVHVVLSIQLLILQEYQLLRVNVNYISILNRWELFSWSHPIRGKPKGKSCSTVMYDHFFTWSFLHPIACYMIGFGRKCVTCVTGKPTFYLGYGLAYEVIPNPYSEYSLAVIYICQIYTLGINWLRITYAKPYPR